MNNPVKNIAIFYHSLENMGGIERVVIELTRIFSANRLSVVLLTEQKISAFHSLVPVKQYVLPLQTEERRKVWELAIRTEAVECVIFHSTLHRHCMEDVNTVKRHGCHAVLTIHFPFPAQMLFNDYWESRQPHREIAERCDAVAVVSHIDLLWWRALGLRAFHVQNPLPTLEPHAGGPPEEKDGKLILWVGRFVEQKQPEEALHIFKLVADRVKDARLVMVGGAPKANRRMRRIAGRLNVADRIRLVDSTPDVAPFYRQASVNLLTSSTESFCLVLAEAKSYGIPTVMYDLPYLELTSGGRGLLTARMGDRQAMADHLCSLLADEAGRRRLGDEARESLRPFNDSAVMAGWQAVFDGMTGRGTEERDTFSREEYETIIREIDHAWAYQVRKNNWKVSFFDQFELFTGRSLRPAVASMQNAFITPLKWVLRRAGRR